MVRARHVNGGAVPKESRLENEGIARGTIHVGIRICMKYSFFVKPTGCLPLFFFGFCERGQILSGIANSRIWRAFLSFCALILFEPFSLLFVFCPHPKMVDGGSAVAVRRQRGGNAAAVAWLGQQWWWQQRRWGRWRKRQRRRVGN